MRKFLAEIVILIAAVIFLMAKLDGIGKPGIAHYMNYFPTETEIVNLGTSHGYDFNYNKTPLKGFAANREGNTLYYDLQNYYSLKEHNRLEEGAIIILPVSYYVFGLDENRLDRDDNTFVDEFYFYLNRSQIYAYSWKKEISLRQYNAQKNFKSQCGIPGKFKKDEPIVYTAPQKKQSQKEKPTHMEKLRNHAEGRTKHHAKLGRMRNGDLSESYLIELITDAKESGYRPVLVTVPYYRLYNEGFDKDWLQSEYFARMKNLSSEFDIPYLNYSHDERFTDIAEMFKDSDHLTDEGAKLFSEIVFGDIEKSLSDD